MSLATNASLLIRLEIMISAIKRITPQSLKQKLRWLLTNTLGYWLKRIEYSFIQRRHVHQLNALKKKDSIKVVFLVIHKSVWKVDNVFQRMMLDPFFEPVIIVCPDGFSDEPTVLKNIDDTYAHFKQKGYPVLKSYNKSDRAWLSLENLSPDLLFFSNPHKITRSDYYSRAFKKYLSCYVPYYFMATDHVGGDDELYNSRMILSMWRVYWPHETAHKKHKSCSIGVGCNGIVTGYPATECFLECSEEEGGASWKKQDTCKKKIIFSPHHTIEGGKNSLSLFLVVADLMVELAKKYQDSIQWSFKPHPILKSKLYLHSGWGKERTELYFGFWEGQEFSQLDEGAYEGLFIESDAIIHDCSSFIVEYAFTRKPALYLANDNINSLLNEFGARVLSTYYLASTKEKIEEFIIALLAEEALVDENRYSDFDNYIESYYSGLSPTERILRDLKLGLGRENA